MTPAIEMPNLILLNAGYAVHNGDWNWKNVCSPFTRIYYVTKGTAAIVFETETVTLTPGNLYIVPSFVKHSNICDSNFEHYYIHVYEDGLSPNHMFEEYDFPHTVIPKESDVELFKRLCELNPSMKLPQSNPVSYDNQPTLIQNIRANKMRNLPTRVETRGILYILAGRFLEHSAPRHHANDDRIQSALNYIRKRIDTKITLDTLAENSSLSNEHFIRLFKKETGMTPNIYITKLKMERAMVMISTSETPVKEVALSLGYDDTSYFIRTFKKSTGMTPQEYRASM